MSCSTELLKDAAVDELNISSGRSTPIFCWSPTPHRPDLFCPSPEYERGDSPDEELYPNCDVKIWLRSCEQEIVKPLQGEILGKIPEWIDGCLLRNGPGSLKVGDMEFKHLFDSSALLHRFFIKDGKVTYQCRFLQSEVYKKNHEAQRIVITEFGTCSVPDPCQTIFNKVAAVFDTSKNQSDNAMISVYPFGDEMYAFTESPIIHRINNITLATEERLDVSKYVTIINHTSHPHVMPDGTVYNLGMSVTKNGLMHNIICFPVKHGSSAEESGSLEMFEDARIVATVPARWMLHPSYMHTFGITENFFMIVEQPLSISIPAVLSSRIKNEPMASNFRWFNNEQTQIHLIWRKSGQTAYKFYTATVFYLHIINQYEIPGYAVIDVCCYRDPSMLHCMFVETMKHMQTNPDYAKMFRGRPLRFYLPLLDDDDITKIKNNENTAKKNLVKVPNTKAKAYLQEDGSIYVKPERLCEMGCETPRINYEKYLGKEYTYFYAISSDVDADNPGTIIKVNTKTKEVKTWCEENCYPSEPIFVPKPDSENEDDGIILSAMVWGKEETNKVGLLVLDAVTMQELGRAVFQTDGPVPKCLHGWYTPST